MNFLQPYMPVVTLIGELTILAVLSILILGFVLLILTVLSIRSDKLLFPRFMRAGLLFLDGMMRGMFRLFGFEDNDFLKILVTLQNTLNRKAFMAVPVEERAVFMPQCLRSNACPAHLHDEGLKCRECGLCKVGEGKRLLELLGYRVFIVPGSSFIKRMIKRYRPKAIIGIGCLIEVKEGIEMSSQIDIVAMGVVNTSDGCVETSADWDEVFRTAILGIPPEKIPEELNKYSNN
ncbi:MAG TPA: DUF116 domain-containing protein [Methanospirillum sp.]|uniref:DUF116 domain-containing protein n=1 Tax=Methanospirillum sp. TaxID=45200 RepID=UPI0009CF4A04|nr:DUF116 domain-containing protein [Methanospirillum sp.]OQB39261.1 MAG: hypothetical protein BWY05_00006 [Euryarchaeota archaeon ADurb.Bin165]HPY60170.1 DUF116 domain-containing protein [Methanospirillum sp.]HQC00131.1 DUF116 domain-containing protein [Methanospirillum sp.]